MGDGAHLGVDAETSMKAVLGSDKDQKQAESTTRSPAELRAIIEAVPVPTGDPQQDVAAIWGYESSANACAHAMLKVVEANPSILTRDRKYTEEEIASILDIPEVKEWMRNGEKDFASVLYDETKKHYPLDTLGLTGFQVGWAMNAVLYIIGAPPEPNPAILEIG